MIDSSKFAIAKRDACAHGASLQVSSRLALHPRCYDSDHVTVWFGAFDSAIFIDIKHIIDNNASCNKHLGMNQPAEMFEFHHQEHFRLI